jgi:hypothetical protein
MEKRRSTMVVVMMLLLLSGLRDLTSSWLGECSWQIEASALALRTGRKLNGLMTCSEI